MVPFSAPFRGGLVLAAFLVVVPLCHGQDPAPAAPPAETSPKDLLKSRELKASGSTWILADESNVLKDLRDARALYRQVEEGIMRRHQLEAGLQNRSGMLEQLRFRHAELDEQIKELDRQSNELSAATGNVYAQQQQNQIARQRNLLVSESNQLVNQLNSFTEQSRQQGSDDDPRLLLNAEIAERREKYMQSLIDLRTSVNQVKAKYDKLGKDAEVKGALGALSQTTRVHQKLGPSKALNDAIKLLEKSEGTVKSESISLLREGGVFHVMATLGRTPTKMVFDTGAGLITLSASLAEKVGVKPAPGDPKVKLRTADGTIVDGKIGLIPSVRVGKFTVPNVECAIMPADKGEVDPLLGQSFLKSFKVEFSADAGKLVLKKVETAATEAEAASAEPSASERPASKAMTKGRRPTRQPRTTTKGRRPAQGQNAPGPDAEPGAADPN